MRRIGAATSLLVLAATASADWHLREVVHKDAVRIAGRDLPASDTPTDIWYTNDKVAVVAETTTMVFDFGKKKAFIVDHANKLFIVAPLPIEPRKVFEKAAVKFTEQHKTTVTVTPTGQTKTIGGLSCSGYDVVVATTASGRALGITLNSAETVSMVMWTTKEIQVDPAIHEQVVANQRRLQLYDEATVAELAKVGGYPVLTEITSEITATGGSPLKKTSRIELKSAGQAEVPVEVFAIPEGYTRRERFDPRDLGVRWPR
jgi:hypothetical protein